MFSKNLSKLRKQHKLTQYELADKLGFSRGQIANYEQGKREPDYETLGILADFFDISTDELLGRKSKEYTYDFDSLQSLMFEDQESFDALSPDEKQEIWDQLMDQADFLVQRKKKKK